MGKTAAAPLSYVGSMRRLAAWARGVSGHVVVRVLAWIGAACAIAVAWAAVTAWYVLTAALFFLVIPYRLIRRSQRKQTELLREIRDRERQG